MTALLIGLLIPLASSGDTPWILLLGPAGAVAVHWGLFQYYRNTDKSHSRERETLIESTPITGTDQSPTILGLLNVESAGGAGGARTHDPGIMSPLL